MPSLRETAIRLMQELTDGDPSELELKKLQGGINSAVFCVEINGKPKAVLKQYPKDYNRDRCVSEANFLRYLAVALPNRAPRLLATLPSESVSLLEWINGKPNPNLRISDSEQFSQFQLGLDGQKTSEHAKSIGPAADAVMCPMDLINQLTYRFNRLIQFPLPTEVQLFLNSEYKPFMEKSIEIMVDACNRLKIDTNFELPREHQTLIASDFGTHNAIRQDNDKLVFIDFEFAGWDDPITAIANFMLHPGMKVGLSRRRPFQDTMLQHFDYIPGIGDRYRVMLPLFGLRWCLIMLNVFIKEEDKPIDCIQQRAKEQMQFKKAYILLRYLIGQNEWQ